MNNKYHIIISVDEGKNINITAHDEYSKDEIINTFRNIYKESICIFVSRKVNNNN